MCKGSPATGCTRWQHALAPGSMCERSPATGCRRRPTGAIAPKAPHARRKLPVHCQSLKTFALRPVSPHSVHDAQAQLGIPTTVGSDRPVPGCPSHTFSALCTPVCGSFEARLPTQRARRASPAGHPNRCSKRSPCARMPVTHFQSSF